MTRPNAPHPTLFVCGLLFCLAALWLGGRAAGKLAAELAERDLGSRAAALSTGERSRLRNALGRHLALFDVVRERVPPGSMLGVWSVSADPLDEAVTRLHGISFPVRVVGFGEAAWLRWGAHPDIAPSRYVLNLSPGAYFPYREAFERVTTGGSAPGEIAFELWRLTERQP